MSHFLRAGSKRFTAEQTAYHRDLLWVKFLQFKAENYCGVPYDFRLKLHCSRPAILELCGGLDEGRQSIALFPMQNIVSPWFKCSNPYENSLHIYFLEEGEALLMWEIETNTPNSSNRVTLHIQEFNISISNSSRPAQPQLIPQQPAEQKQEEPEDPRVAGLINSIDESR